MQIKTSSMKLTSLEEACVLLYLWIPACAMNGRVPELFDRLALREANDDTAHIYHELTPNDSPQKAASPCRWGNDFQKEKGVRDPAKARTHDGEELAEIDPFDCVHDAFMA